MIAGLDQQVSNCGPWTRGALHDPFRGSEESNNLGIRVRHHWSFDCVDICTDGVKAMVGQTGGT